MEQAATTNAMNRVDVQEAKKTVRDYAYNISAAIANAILVTLGMGLLMQTVAGFVHWQPLFEAGTLAQALLAPALGLAVASQLRSPPWLPSPPSFQPPWPPTPFPSCKRPAPRRPCNRWGALLTHWSLVTPSSPRDNPFPPWPRPCWRPS